MIDEEKNYLEKVLRDTDTTTDSKYSKNYILFSELIDNWLKTLSPEKNELKLFINSLLNNIVLLPIKCGALDDALTIFETINNRGLSLSDIDRFKAKLHKFASLQHEETEFIRRWREVNNKHSDIFRIYMYILRAKENNTEKEISLRSFFTAPNSKRFQDWKTVMDDIERIDSCINFHEGDCPDDTECESCSRKSVCKWFQVLEFYPNQYWQYPIYTFLFKKLENNNLNQQLTTEYETLLKDTIRFCYVKAIIYNSVNVIRDSIFKVCAQIWKGEAYKNIYQDSLKDDYNKINISLNGNFQRSVRGLCFLHAYLNPKQKFISYDAHIEHILPKNWNNYDGWTEDSHSIDVGKLGNLVVLERKLNINAKNEFFEKKQIYYEKSEVLDAQALCNSHIWNKEALEHRHNKIILKLEHFFRNTVQ